MQSNAHPSPPSDDDALATMFANLLKGGLVDRATLVENGFTDAASAIMTEDRDATWRRARSTTKIATATRKRVDEGDDDEDKDDEVRGSDPLPSGSSLRRVGERRQD